MRLYKQSASCHGDIHDGESTYQAAPYNQIPLSATTLVLVFLFFKPYGDYL